MDKRIVRSSRFGNILTRELQTRARFEYCRLRGEDTWKENEKKETQRVARRKKRKGGFETAHNA